MYYYNNYILLHTELHDKLIKLRFEKIFRPANAGVPSGGLSMPAGKNIGCGRFRDSLRGGEMAPTSGSLNSLYTRTQRTEKPFARLLLLTGFTPPELKFKFPALTSEEYGELLQ